MQQESHYTFGDSSLASERLRWLAAAYDAPSTALLERFAPREPAHAVDLGCGPGHTTRLLRRILKPKRTTGIDASERFLAEARKDAPLDVEFLRHDVLAPPFPVPVAQVIFARHLLTHLGETARALASFSELAAVGALLLVQETETLDSDDPTLARYYECVAILQRAYAQRTLVGGELERAFSGTRWSVLHSAGNELQQDARDMARLHVMNLASWRRDPVALAAFDGRELDALEQRLQAIASGEVRCEPVRNVLREIVARREP